MAKSKNKEPSLFERAAELEEALNVLWRDARAGGEHELSDAVRRASRELVHPSLTERTNLLP